jgi:uncharacterized membrane-anchored protein
MPLVLRFVWLIGGVTAVIFGFIHGALALVFLVAAALSVALGLARLWLYRHKRPPIRSPTQARDAAFPWKELLAASAMMSLPIVVLAAARVSPILVALAGRVGAVIAGIAVMVIVRARGS